MKNPLKNESIPFSILDSIPNGTLIIGEKGEILHANEAAALILGKKFENIKQCTLNTCFTSHNQPFFELLTNALQKRKEIKNEDIIYTYKRKQFILRVNSIVWENVQKKHYNMIIFIQDITEIWKSHVKVRTMHAQLRKNYINLLDNLRQIADSVAHEMRNPVVAIGGYANHLLKKVKKEQESQKINCKVIKKYIRYIMNDANRLNKIVEQVERYVHNSDVKFKKENMPQFFNDIIQYAKRSARKEQKTIDIAVSQESEYNVHIDKKKLKKVLQDIVKHSIFFADDCSELTLHIQYTIYDIIFTIEIFTKKIDKKEIDYIFNPFYSVHNEKLHFDFAAAQRIIILHGGIIKPYWKNKLCLCFEIDLPQDKRIHPR
jgi:PAS domain S-box-containing protein